MSRIQRNLFASIVASAMIGACSFSPNVPNGHLICQSPSECPSGYTCEGVTGAEVAFKVCCKDKGCGGKVTNPPGVDGSSDLMTLRDGQSTLPETGPNPDGSLADLSRDFQDDPLQTPDLATPDLPTSDSPSPGDTFVPKDAPPGPDGPMSDLLIKLDSVDAPTLADAPEDAVSLPDLPPPDLKTPDAQGTCGNDQDCPTTAPMCLKGVCARCTAASDCAGNALGGMCDTSTGRCASCLADTDCKDATKPLCGQGKCTSCTYATSPSGCCADNDCTTGGASMVGKCNTAAHTCSYTCDTNHKSCTAGGPCIPTANCCTSPECTGGGTGTVGTCGASNTCSYACDATHKSCTPGGPCIPTASCCASTECSGGAANTVGTCGATNTCSYACDATHKSCTTGGPCIPIGGCCTSAECTGGTTGTMGTCGATNTCSYACDATHRSCTAGGPCIPNANCCGDGDCTGNVANECQYKGCLADTTCGVKNKPNTSSCSSGTGMCDGNGACIVCSAGQYKCAGSVLQKCNTTRTGFDQVFDCVTANMCNPSGPSCYSCSAGEYKCTGSLLQKCNTARTGFDQVFDCVTANLCNPSGPSCYSCSAGEYKCTGSLLQQCNATRTGFTPGTNCGNANLCNPSGPSCYNCVPSAPFCDSIDPHTARTCSSDGQTSTPNTDPNKWCLNGQLVQCRTVSDCPNPTNPCIQKTCTANVCGTTNVAVSTSCAGNGACDGAGHCNGPASRKSCPAGQALCQGVSCCQDILVTGGMFPMGLGSGSEPDVCPSGLICDTNAETPEHSTTVADFYMDTFEVTVGRFREFWKKYGGSGGSAPPADGAGQNPHVSGSGWQSSAWNTLLAPTQAALTAGLACPTGGTPTWGPASPPDTEVRAINCVTWYEAFAFCIWDGGRLPTEAEWEYAAAAGAANQLYPWGQAAPDSTRANYYRTNQTPLISVGSFPAGVGAFGQLDLAGGMGEWTLDWYSDSWYDPGPGNPCTNCADISTPLVYRSYRGGTWRLDTTNIRAAARSGSTPASRTQDVGFRCVRDRG
jgi:formylglycine-generating enzyme required for sulfatase activity